MMKELVAQCQSNDVSVISRCLTVIEGICKVLETVPDSDIVGEVVLHFIDDLNVFLRTMWEMMVGILPQFQSNTLELLLLIDDYDKLELILTCLLLIANTRRYWIMVDVIRDINTDHEQEDASCIDLDIWMSFFSVLLQYNNPMFCTFFFILLFLAENPTATVLEELKASIISFCTV